MITIFLVILLTTEPIPTFGWLGGFDTMKACRDHIKEKVKPELRERMNCWMVVKGHIVEA